MSALGPHARAFRALAQAYGGAAATMRADASLRSPRVAEEMGLRAALLDMEAAVHIRAAELLEAEERAAYEAESGDGPTIPAQIAGAKR